MAKTGKTQTPAHRLVLWYEQNHRNMPWRQTSDPYAIWVSETMLQQTRVETVIPYFAAFMQKFPTVSALAAADQQTVLKMWQGLGYYSRARNLHAAAQQIVREHAGRVPPELDAFRSLPGVGPYTAGAVFSIAFNQPVPAVDGNVLRVMARYSGIFDPIETAAVQRAIRGTVSDWLQEAEPRLLTQALMELGATVCTPRSPRCDQCPLAEGCRARADGVAEQLPVRKQKAARRVVDIVAVWWEVDGEVWVEQWASEGLLANLWQLPAWEVEAPSPADDAALHGTLRRRIAEWLGADAPEWLVREPKTLEFAEIARERHVFSHLEWQVHVLRPVSWTANVQPCAVERRVRMPRGEIASLPLPRVYEKLFSAILGDNTLEKEVLH